ncbi:hypothetical protein [Ruficoccus sp. ZRK36]|uniref:hypothetical protein n=1 Tax=Ruficoccus sp. ZRK36 TaxID=2866311 RepID=UPI001C7346C9|nr:hypothetical protein [Ruficoccus sp. ZRK36]QYY34805.1 hypothetical protein K0V07_10890 [Ruficoccus sp. ZRK36]
MKTKKFSDVLESIREEKGLNRVEFARALDSDRARMYDVLKGRLPGHLFIRRVLSLPGLSEQNRRDILCSYLQMHLEEVAPESELSVHLL